MKVGISGWNYKGWRGPFYPPDLPQRRELEYAASAFDSIELNRTFYSLTTATSCRRWYETAPVDFVYAVKGSRFITHNKKLADVDSALANFFAAGILELGDKLGPVLWQLSAKQRFDPERLERFLAKLPSTMDEAADLARAHDDRVKDPGLGPGGNRAIRHALEVRHDSFRSPEFVEILRRHEVALAFSHSSRWPYLEELTTDFVYVRLHGPEQLYDSAYGEDGLADWAVRLRRWERGDEPKDAVRITDLEPPAVSSREVYVYFDNDGHAYAPREAVRLMELISEE